MSRTGVRERPIAGPDERLTDYAARAGAQALERAGVEPADVDLVIVANADPGRDPAERRAPGRLRAGRRARRRRD